MFQFPITLHKGATSAPYVAPVVTSLSLLSTTDIAAAILQKDDGPRSAGLYLYDGKAWHMCLPSLEVSKAVIYGYDLAIYFALTADTQAATGSTVFRNSAPHTGLTMKAGSAVYCTELPVSSGGGGAGVGSINGLTGALTFQGDEGLVVDTVNPTITITPGSLDEGTF